MYHCFTNTSQASLCFVTLGIASDPGLTGAPSSTVHSIQKECCTNVPSVVTLLWELLNNHKHGLLVPPNHQILWVPLAAPLLGEVWGPLRVSALCDYKLLEAVGSHVHPFLQIPGFHSSQVMVGDAPLPFYGPKHPESCWPVMVAIHFISPIGC